MPSSSRGLRLRRRGRPRPGRRHDLRVRTRSRSVRRAVPPGWRSARGRRRAARGILAGRLRRLARAATGAGPGRSGVGPPTTSSTGGVGNGGGWPTTLQDVAAALDLLAELDLDLTRVVTIGHSAGGHLAAWAAGRSTLPPSAPGFVAAGGGDRCRGPGRCPRPAHGSRARRRWHGHPGSPRRRPRRGAGALRLGGSDRPGAVARPRRLRPRPCRRLGAHRPE